MLQVTASGRKSRPGQNGRRKAGLSPARAAASPPAELTPQFAAELQMAFDSNPAYQVALNAVTQTGADDIALNRAVVTGTDFTFSHWLDSWPVTAQKSSGRCWMFAGLNLLRAGAMKAMNVEAFEFSQNYTFFWDKLERANYFLEKILETADRDVDDRNVAFLLGSVLGDGGQWNMFVNIVKKYGVVPKAAMPETESSSNSGRMNSILASAARVIRYAPATVGQEWPASLTASA